ncbi:MAG: helix-turn-helix domain-containing protein [Oligosphaeraceae bacterium]
METPSTPQRPVFSQGWPNKPNANVIFHTHPGTELILVTRGTCAITVGNIPWTVPSGHILVIPPETQHDQRPLTDATLNSFVVFFDPHALFDPTPRLIDVSDTPVLCRLFDELCAMNCDGQRDLCAIYLPPLLEALQIHEQRERERSDEHPALARALRHLDRHLHDPFSLPELAHLAGISVPQLRRLFNQRFNCSPQRYIQNRRMAIARSLLANPTLTVAEIAAQCGYPDGNYFSRLFHKLHRCSPIDYRAFLLGNGSVFLDSAQRTFIRT